MSELTIKIKVEGNVTPELVNRVIEAYDLGNGMLQGKFADGLEFSVTESGKPAKKKVTRKAPAKPKAKVDSTADIKQEVAAKVEEALQEDSPAVEAPVAAPVAIPATDASAPAVDNPLMSGIPVVG